jgi:hypothetical protein
MRRSQLFADGSIGTAYMRRPWWNRDARVLLIRRRKAEERKSMRKTWIAIALIAAASSSAASQISGVSLAPDVAQSFSGLASNIDMGPKLDEKICLIRKSSGRTECRYKDEWREVAKTDRESTGQVSALTQ